MPLIQLLEVLVVVGILLWLVNRFVPMQGSIKSILNGVVVIAVVLWLCNVFGICSIPFPGSTLAGEHAGLETVKNAKRTNTTSIHRNTADICLKEIF